MIFMLSEIFSKEVVGSMSKDITEKFFNVVDLKVLLVIFVINIARRNYFIFSL
jgi:hypothetical protein